MPSSLAVATPAHSLPPEPGTPAWRQLIRFSGDPLGLFGRERGGTDSYSGRMMAHAFSFGPNESRASAPVTRKNTP